MKLIFEKSATGRQGVKTPMCDVPTRHCIPRTLLRCEPAELPELTELDVVRHFTKLSTRNIGIDTTFYPLGSCTMKYNPKVTEKIARISGFEELHPLLPQLKMGETLTQGALEVLYETDCLLKEISGMDGFTMQPMAGAHGELTGVLMMSAYHRDKGHNKKTVLVPDSAHGTNPATAAIAGYDVVSVPSSEKGLLNIETLKRYLNDEVAGLMLTCPNTLGIFNPHIKEICDLIHSVNGLVYYDGANLNAIVGKTRPGDIGFDIVHVNLHKTFATPHGGGGPGAGPVGVKGHLTDYLPVSIVAKTKDGAYTLEYDRRKTIGYIAPFYGNFGVVLKAYAYLLMLGKEGLERVAENSVLNANYMKEKLKDDYNLPIQGLCKHEFVLSAKKQAKNGVHAIDIAKKLIDNGFHPPTMYFPSIISEALMIEPTETESKETMDAFIKAMVELAHEANENPNSFKHYPMTTPVSRLDEIKAAREINVVHPL